MSTWYDKQPNDKAVYHT